MWWLLIGLGISVASIIVALLLFFFVDKKDPGSKRMQEIASYIHEGARAFLKRQNLSLLIFVAAMSVVLFFTLGWVFMVAYIFGSMASAAAGLIGMEVAVRANVRSTNAAHKKGLREAFSVAYFGGAVMGLSVVGFALLGIVTVYWITGDVNILLGFSLGASSMALFAKAGGGIYTKTADISADLVGKVELGLPEDDPRNPAVIADNVGDNVGDVAGMGADLFDSYVASIVAAMILGYEQYTKGLMSFMYVYLPILIAAAGIASSLLALITVKLSKGSNPGAILNRITFASVALFLILLYVIVTLTGANISVFVSTAAGLLAGLVMGLATDYFTSIDRPPTQKIAEAATTGAAINILTGFSYGIESAVPAIVGVGTATMVAWYVSQTFGLNPLYGIAISAVGMLAIVGTIVSSDAYGPIADNAKGIAEQANLGEEPIKILDRLDAAGNTTKAITKGFAIGAAALTVLALFATYAELVDLPLINLINPNVVTGIFIGAMMPPLFSAMVILAVGKNAEVMIDEIRRQVKEKPGILDGTEKPDYARCVDIAEKGALMKLIPPGIISTVVPIITGLILGTEALGGFLAGSIVTGFIFALFMANSGGAWDNAKKFIEDGHYGGKGSEAHKAAVVGDTVGDPFKDTAGPSLNTMITVMSLVASTFAPLIAQFALVWA